MNEWYSPSQAALQVLQCEPKLSKLLCHKHAEFQPHPLSSQSASTSPSMKQPMSRKWTNSEKPENQEGNGELIEKDHRSDLEARKRDAVIQGATGEKIWTGASAQAVDPLKKKKL